MIKESLSVHQITTDQEKTEASENNQVPLTSLIKLKRKQKVEAKEEQKQSKV